MNPKKGKIFLIPTLLSPGTEEKVIPEYNKHILKKINYYLVENERSARRFISSLGLGIVIERIKFYLLDKDTQYSEVKKFFEEIPDMEDVGVISEAGCPGIADPGSRAVAYGHMSERDVIPLIGPSSILLALIGSGFSGQKFTFHGYLPINKGERINAIKSLENMVHKNSDTQIFMETPYRNNSLLDDLLSTCQNQTALCIACNVSGDDQFLKTKTVKAWKIEKPDLHKKPTIFLLGKVST
ncbi:MAG: SAM-dependent methyltransferase [Cytophagaceae bacterium]